MISVRNSLLKKLNLWNGRIITVYKARIAGATPTTENEPTIQTAIHQA